MNILYVHNVGKIGGAERVTLDVIRGLDNHSHKAFLVAPENGPFLDEAKVLGAEASVLKIQQPEAKKAFATIKGYRRWLKYLRTNKIDLIHTGDLFVTRTLLWAGNKLDIPLVCHVHFPISASALRWIFKIGSDNCHFVYCSQELNDTIAPRVESVMKAASHQVIHNGVDVDRFRPFEPKKGILPSGHINIGIVANLQERKGHLDLIEAIAKIYPDYPNIRIHIIGGDVFGESRENTLKNRIEELGLDAVFVFHGQVNNVRDYLNELDIIVCVSYEEAFPISILESMAFELPIASTDVNGIPEALIHEYNSLLNPRGAPEKIAESLERILSDSVLRKNIGLSARKVVCEKFSIVIFWEKIESLYKKVRKQT